MRFFIVGQNEFQARILGGILVSRNEGEVLTVATDDPGSRTADDDDILFIEADLFDAVKSVAPAGVSLVVTGIERKEEVLASKIAAGAHAALTRPFTSEGVAAALADLRLMKEIAG